MPTILTRRFPIRPRHTYVREIHHRRAAKHGGLSEEDAQIHRSVAVNFRYNRGRSNIPGEKVNWTADFRFHFYYFSSSFWLSTLKSFIFGSFFNHFLNPLNFLRIVSRSAAVEIHVNFQKLFLTTNFQNIKT